MNIYIAYIQVSTYYSWYILYIDKEGYLERNWVEGKKFFLERCKQREHKLEEGYIYMCFQGSGYDAYFTDFDLFTFDSLHENEADVSESYHQEIISPANTTSMSIYRFFLTAQKASYAYYIINKTNLQNTERIISSRYNISLLSPFSFKIHKLTGASVQLMEIETLKIKRLLGEAFGYRIKQLVVDFIKDHNGKYWIRAVHSFTLANVIYIYIYIIL